MEIIKKFNLPSFIKGKSFSEASALIAKRFEDRNSPEDIATLNDLQGRLQQAQEYVKAEQEARTKPQQVPGNSSFNEVLNPSVMNSISASQENPQENSFFLGGLMEGNTESGIVSQSGKGGPGAGGYIGAASGAMELADMAFGDTGIDTSGKTAAPNVPSKGASTADGAMKGLAAGQAFGPWGAVAGAVLGGTAGFIGGGKAQKDAEKANRNYDLNIHNQATNSYKHGGPLHSDKDNPYAETENLLAEMKNANNQNKFREIGVNDWSLENDERESRLQEVNDFTSGLEKNNLNNKVSLEDGALNNVMKDNTSETSRGNKTKFNPSELLRYAPTAMNIAQLANLKKPSEVGFDRINSKYNEQLVDERGLQNVVKEGVLNNRDAILSSSGGSGSAARASLLASQLQGQKAQSQAYQQAGAENRQERRRAQDFNLNVDSANISQSNQEKMTNLQLKAGYETNKSKLLSQLGDDLGGIGQEELLKRYPELMGLSYNSKGKHITSSKKKK